MSAPRRPRRDLPAAVAEVPEDGFAARLLRWGAILAHGRQIPLERQSDPRRMPPNCYTFQPQRLAQVQRIVAIRDFSRGGAQPLESIEIADAAELL